ncbi:hypothetical protein CSUI_006003, partial [Cystoisospora suis]
QIIPVPAMKSIPRIASCFISATIKRCAPVHSSTSNSASSRISVAMPGSPVAPSKW